MNCQNETSNINLQTKDEITNVDNQTGELNDINKCKIAIITYQFGHLPVR